MKLYHRTNKSQSILKGGFKGTSRSYPTSEGSIELTGNFFSDRPVDVNEGAKGNDLLMIEIPEDVIAEFELVDEDGTYREFLIPENISNGYGNPKLIDG